MRRRIGLWVAVVLTAMGALAIVAGGLRAEPHAPVALERPPQDDSFSLAQARARVVEIDPDGGRVVLSLPGEEVQLRIDERTTIFVGGRPGGLGELEAGQAVCAAWTARRAPVAEWLEPCSE